MDKPADLDSLCPMVTKLGIDVLSGDIDGWGWEVSANGSDAQRSQTGLWAPSKYVAVEEREDSVLPHAAVRQGALTSRQ